MGYTVLPPASSLASAADSVAEAPGVDLIVTSLLQGQTEALIEDARASARLGATPVLALLTPESYSALLTRHGNDPLFRPLRSGVTAEQFAEAATALTQRAAGPAVTPEEARSYSTRAVAALREIATGGPSAFQASDALRPLIAALESAKGDLRLQTADVLAHMNDADAQTRVLEAALASAGAERIGLLAKVGESARRFGNMLPDRLVTRLVELTSSADAAEATSAAALMGALNLPGSRMAPLILGAKETGKPAK